MTNNHPAARIDVLGFSKRFGAFQALQDVSLTVEAGTVHALLGENGAGKSTLVKALIGFQSSDTGSLSVDGREESITSPRDAARLGLGMIFQHFTVAPGMTVQENLALADRGLSGFIDWKKEHRKLADFMATAPFPLPLDRMVAELSAGEKQKLEILKQLYNRRRFLILDEPTSVLTPGEADEVLSRLQAMCRAKQLSVLMITHKFREVFAYCDEVTVLRRGRVTGQAKVADANRDMLAAWMVGASDVTGVPASARAEPGEAVRESSDKLVGGAAAESAGIGGKSMPPSTASFASPTNLASEPRLDIAGLVVEGGADGLPAVNGISLQVRPGEIVGIAGVSGNGQRELMEALTGVQRPTGGTIAVDGQPFEATRAQMRERRVNSLPEEPLTNACVAKLSVEENLALRNFDRAPIARARWWLSRRAVRAQAKERIDAYRVKTTGPQAAMGSLSGGNVQRAVLARELSQQPRLLIVANPCFGLDFQAGAEIHARLRAARDGGAAVLLISEDLDELLSLSTRLLVMSHGHIAHECTLGGTVDIAAIGRAMAGESTALEPALA